MKHVNMYFPNILIMLHDVTNFFFGSKFFIDEL